MPDQLCGKDTHKGRPCQQNTDVFPCRYHDATSFNAVIKSLTEMISRAGGWVPFMAAHAAPDTVTPIRRAAGRR